MSADAREWIEPYVGFTFDVGRVEVTAVHQADKLGACGIDAGVFGEDVDPSFFIGLGIQAGINSGITAEGNINMLQSLRQLRPVRLGETLTVEGRIIAIEPVPRGRSVNTEVSFKDAAGDEVVRADRISLKPDPDKTGTRGAGDKPAPLVGDPAELVRERTYQLQPAGVKAYSSEGNSIHYEEEAARRAGFRAPLIGGGMGVHFVMAALWRLGAPQTFDARIYFRRPIFWDEAVTVVMDRAQQPRVMALLKPDGKVGTEVGFA